MTDDVLAARIAVRVVALEIAACRTLLPVAQLKALAAMTAVLARSQRLPPCALPGYRIEPISRTVRHRLRGAGAGFF
jgi:hypothetical protein